jgi:hypothetical protein
MAQKFFQMFLLPYSDKVRKKEQVKLKRVVRELIVRLWALTKLPWKSLTVGILLGLVAACVLFFFLQSVWPSA